MSDRKLRLPIYAEPSGFNGEEELALYFNPAAYVPPDCFSHHSQSKTSIQYHSRGLKALHQGYWSLDQEERKQHFQTAFGFFHLAHHFDKKYFCTREALSRVAGLLGLDSVEGGEKYVNSLESTPTIDELALRDGEDPDPHYVCHLLDPGFYSASDLSRLEASLKEEKR